ncbi:MAG TPA: hypothetical protein PLR20_01490 [Syntrophales bacterium]|nr:hypothetical protein [Syntrophales bacterium]HOX93586.1 hypothetical protein [Syntrophales bacterium]HPI56881.1 hypothetical protein [Syntrophales bacterium]HPN23467.1 hypothetical protein [Syntrophales bacterium]HQM28008.1 hypothetical protein [Syntrophales bacterium]
MKKKNGDIPELEINLKVYKTVVPAHYVKSFFKVDGKTYKVYRTQNGGLQMIRGSTEE